MEKKKKPEPDFHVIAKAERYLNRVLGYQAAIAVHQLMDDFGLDVEELNLTVAPISDAVGVYRVVCTIARANMGEPVVVEAIVEPEKALAFADKGGRPKRPPLAKTAGQTIPSK